VTATMERLGFRARGREAIGENGRVGGHCVIEDAEAVALPGFK
jgi:hypothetical protein